MSIILMYSSVAISIELFLLLWNCQFILQYFLFLILFFNGIFYFAIMFPWITLRVVVIFMYPDSISSSNQIS